MPPFERLTVLSLSEIQGNVERLKQGVIEATPSSDTSPRQACRQPLQFSTHFDPQVPRILQLASEILKTILGYLEPIWLFQVTAAFPSIDQVCPNLLWYNAIPPSLYLEPEHFQDENEVQRKIDSMVQHSGWVGMESYVPIFSGVQPFGPELFHFTELTTETFSFPGYTGLSDLANQVELHETAKHPQNVIHYPCLANRSRLLALGGPFRTEVEYKRELAGHFHLGKRCFICLELLVNQRYRPSKIEWLMPLCVACLQEYTLTYEQIREITGLPRLMALERKNLNSVWVNHHRPRGETQWKPLVDHVLRQSIGLDYDTTLAAEIYIKQVLAMLKKSKKAIEVNRREVRNNIVAVAQQMWEKGFGDEEMQERVAQLRHTFAPAEDLPKFLFPTRLLDETQLFHPYDHRAFYIKDPTLELKSSRDLLKTNTSWINEKALALITKLGDWNSRTYNNNGGGAHVTSWVQAATAYHMRRLEIKFAQTEMLVRSIHINPLHLYGTSGTHDQALEIICQKLGLQRKFYPSLPQLNKHDKFQGKRALTKILVQACQHCPYSGLMAPRGLQSLIDHIRTAHYRFFWAGMWEIRG